MSWVADRRAVLDRMRFIGGSLSAASCIDGQRSFYNEVVRLQGILYSILKWKAFPFRFVVTNAVGVSEWVSSWFAFYGHNWLDRDMRAGKEERLWLIRSAASEEKCSSGGQVNNSLLARRRRFCTCRNRYGEHLTGLWFAWELDKRKGVSRIDFSKVAAVELLLVFSLRVAPSPLIAMRVVRLISCRKGL